MEPFESQINDVCKELLRQGKAFIEKRPVLHVMVKGKPLYAQKSPYDFVGLKKGGQFVGIEAKHISSSRLSIGKTGDLKLHQLIALLDTENLGGLAFVLWKHNDKILMIKPSEISKIYPQKKKSITFDDFSDDKKYNDLNFLYYHLGGKPPLEIT